MFRDRLVWISGTATLVLALMLGPVGARGTAHADQDDESHDDGVMVFQVDPVHSRIGFKVKHFVSRVPGQFLEFSGTVHLDPDDLATFRLDGEIVTESVDTGNKRRDTHLRSKDFFNVEEFPTITFKTSEAKIVDKNNLAVSGEITIRGVTKPLTLEVEVLGVGPGLRGKLMTGLEARGTVKRKDFGMVWNKVLDTGGFMLGENVMLTLQIEAGHTPETESAD